MKVLCLNTSPDISFFTKRGLILDVTYETCDKIFPPIKSGTTTNTDGTSVTLYSPDVRQYLENTYKNTKYDVIFFEWKPEDYGTEFKYSGGQTFRTKLSNGAYFATIRRGVPNAVIHEMMHIIGQILYVDLKKYDAVDQMDATRLADGTTKFYYLNSEPENPASNFAVTWNSYKKYLPELNKTMPTYKYFKLTEKTNASGTHTIAELKPELVAKLDLTRGDAGIPFVIDSGLRTPAENKAAGGVANSAHLTGEAVDIRCFTSETRYKIVIAAIKNGFNRIGIGKNYVHLDISKTLTPNVIWHYYQ